MTSAVRLIPAVSLSFAPELTLFESLKSDDWDVQTGSRARSAPRAPREQTRASIGSASVMIKTLSISSQLADVAGSSSLRDRDALVRSPAPCLVAFREPSHELLVRSDVPALAQVGAASGRRSTEKKRSSGTGPPNDRSGPVLVAATRALYANPPARRRPLTSPASARAAPLPAFARHVPHPSRKIVPRPPRRTCRLLAHCPVNAPFCAESGIVTLGRGAIDRMNGRSPP